MMSNVMTVTIVIMMVIAVTAWCRRCLCELKTLWSFPGMERHRLHPSLRWIPALREWVS